MDFSVFAPKAAKKPEKQAEQKPEMQVAPPQEEVEFVEYGGAGEYMGGYRPEWDQPSQIRRLKSIELTHTRSLKVTFMDDFDDYYYGHGPHMYNEMHHHSPRGYLEHGYGCGPAPPPRRIRPGPPPPPPMRYMHLGSPPPRRVMAPGPFRYDYYGHEPPRALPHAGYPPRSYFDD